MRVTFVLNMLDIECFAVLCNVLQCVAVCCNVLHWVEMCYIQNIRVTFVLNMLDATPRCACPNVVQKIREEFPFSSFSSGLVDYSWTRHVTMNVIPARFTSRPEARGSGPEAVFRFLGSGVDFF